MRMDVRL